MGIVNLFGEPDDPGLVTINQISEFLKLEGHVIAAVSPILCPDSKGVRELVLHMYTGAKFTISYNDQGNLEVTQTP